jgi:GT2 family glycosyltransferase
MNKILIVLVIYEHVISKSNAFITLAHQVNSLNVESCFYIYDNSQKSQLFCTDIDHIYIHDQSNAGVSLAYNNAFDFALKNGFEWVMLSDQDTKYPNEYLQSVIKYIISVKSLIFAPILKENNIFLSPVIFRNFRGTPISILPETGFVDFNSRFWPLNSAMLVNREIFREINFDNKAKLDFSDFIFIDRVSKKINSYYLMDITISHSLSSNMKQSISKSILRYKFYITGLKQYSKQINALKTGFIFLILRSTYLNFKFKTLKFYFNLNEYFKN